MPRVALLVLVALLTVSCEGPIGPTGPQGPGGPQGPQGETGEPFDWGEVVESENLEAGVFGIGILYDHPSGSRRLSLIGTGFNAEYPNALWTNAHVVQGLEERLDIWSDRNPEAVAFRSGSMLGGQERT